MMDAFRQADSSGISRRLFAATRIGVAFVSGKCQDVANGTVCAR